MELLLTRVYHAKGTDGILTLDGKQVCHTIELPWLENARGVSCIPEGRYGLTKYSSTRFPRHLLVKDVPDRSYILLHAANNALHDLKGCIAPVFVPTRPGCGFRSREALAIVVQLVYDAIERQEPVFLIIQSEKSLNNGNSQSA